MNKKHEISLFIFRRDLRLFDNTGLIKALSESEEVIPLFICTPIQLSEKNKYKSSNAIQFMIESLYDLDEQINKINKKCTLWITYDEEIRAINKIYKKINFTGIYVNDDYSPYAIKRDRLIKNYCDKNGIEFNTSTDILLLGDNDIKTNDDKRYVIFTQFYKRALGYDIKKINVKKPKNFKPITKEFKDWTIMNVDEYLLRKRYYSFNNRIAIHGGRQNGKKILKNIAKFRNYGKTHNIVEKQTTMLSAHNKFGTVSIREVYYAFKNVAKSKDLCRQLYWRDFYYYVGIYFKKLYNYEHIRKHTGNKIKWDNDKKLFNKWKSGQTGFPIVDAAMRQLNTTGYMHNRARLIAASFLVKDLLIDWRHGEKYFTKKLVDIDRAQNIGNWNWCSSFGLDATPYLRIPNPWTQSAKYDANCNYIKKWVPELKDIEPKYIHRWYKYHKLYPHVSYPEPIVDHDTQRKIFIKFYKKYFK